MNGLRLYLRSRHVIIAVVVVAVINLAGWIIGRAEFRPNEDSVWGVPWLLFLPVASAVAVALSLRSPSDTLDRVAARPLAAWRGVHLLVVVIPSIVGTVLLSSLLSGPYGAVAGLRNVVGFTGLTLLSAVVIEGRLCWLAPLGWGIVAMTLGDPRSGMVPFDWPVRYDDDFGAFVVALVFAVAGMAAVLLGTREPRHEDQ